jgi:DUF4097 and DUF4098 domain-containing protein YvlB
MKMKNFTSKRVFMVLLMSVLFLGMQLMAGEKKVVNKTFDAKDILKISTASGDIKIETTSGNKIKVELKYTFSSEYFEPIMEEKGDTLVLKEKFKKSWDWKGQRKGMSKWTVMVPANTKIEASSASGDVKIAGIKKPVSARTASGDLKLMNCAGGLEIKSASGDIKVNKADGDIKAKTASGDIKLYDVTGALKVKSASGDLKVSGVAFTGASELEAVSGDVEVQLAKANKFDLNLGTVSGDITLDYNGNPVKGFFTFKGMKSNLHSDVPFDNSEGSKYNPFAKKYFKKGDSPKITAKTVSGDISFKK